jgi:hypothetical protein
MAHELKVQIKTLNNNAQHNWAGSGLLGLDGPKPE